MRAFRISDLSELKREWLDGVRLVGVTSGASTPTPITKEVVAYLEQYDENDPETWELKRTVNMKRLLPVVREKSKS